MTTANLTDLDIVLRDAVIRQLDWEPQVDASAIGVAAKNGVVTLSGYIDTYAGKLAAERAAKGVRGVRAVANDIDVRLKLGRTDPEIAADAVQALQIALLTADSIQVAVHAGHITLTGKVAWAFQRRNAEEAVRHIRGLRGVMNHITVTPRVAAREVRHRIVEALHRTADLDARSITATVSGNTVSLTGQVRTWLQRELAERAAANAPGIGHVDNRLVVEPGDALGDAVPDDMC